MTNNETTLNLLIAFACGLLLFAAWPVSPLTLLILGRVPCLAGIQRKPKKFFGLTYMAMFIGM
jgi:hypothetical protein